MNENRDIYDTLPMRAALGLYTGHKAPAPDLPMSPPEDTEPLTETLEAAMTKGDYDDDAF